MMRRPHLSIPSRPVVALGCGLFCGLVAAGPSASADEDAARRHLREIESWRQERLEGLRQPDSWLTLVGLAWLREGENTCGSDPESDVVLPESVPARVGVLRVRDERVEIEATGSQLRHAGEPVGRLVLKNDTEGEPTVLELGSVTFYVIRRGDRFGVRIKDRESPMYAGFRGLDYFPVSWDWRVEARFKAYDPPRTVEIPTILGTAAEMVSPGAVIFQVAGREYRLEAFEGSDEDELFLVFGDRTNKQETYGGGRFLYAHREPGGGAVVDFNKAYSPPCVFSPYATCPLPPPENRLDMAVRAGEKTYDEH